MNTCGTCAYLGDEVKSWDIVNDEYVPVAIYHRCDLVKHINDCELSIQKQEVAGVMDGSGYAATLCVTDEFGCNQWMPK